MRFFATGLLICVIAPLLCSGCALLMEKTGQAIDGSAFTEKKIAIYRTEGIIIREVRNRAGEHLVIIMLEKFPSIRLRGSVPDAQEEIFFTTMYYLGSNPHGWNEFNMDISGYGKLVLGETTATLSITGEIEPVQISWGRIRRYDTRITGAEALTNLRNRHERIIALAEWMNTCEGAPRDASRKDFEKYWKPVLFPELVFKKKRPEGWRQEGDQRVRAESILWNSGYTERVFPEELRIIRNSGTMLRDWEEAFEWIYTEYEWNRITELLAREIVLNKDKR